MPEYLHCVSCNNVTLGAYPSQSAAVESVRTTWPGAVEVCRDDAYGCFDTPEDGEVTVVAVRYSPVPTPLVRD